MTSHNQLVLILRIRHCLGNVSTVGFINEYLQSQCLDLDDASSWLGSYTSLWYWFWPCCQCLDTPMMQATLSTSMENVHVTPTHRQWQRRCTNQQYNMNVVQAYEQHPRTHAGPGYWQYGYHKPAQAYPQALSDVGMLSTSYVCSQYHGTCAGPACRHHGYHKLEQSYLWYSRCWQTLNIQL